MTDITTPAQMREADYCPFCGGITETDFYQPYRSIGGKLGKACAIYCIDCSANMTICHEDHPGVDPEHLMSALVTEWNRRALLVAEPKHPAEGLIETPDAPRALTEAELRSLFLNVVEGYVRYWASEAPGRSLGITDRLDGLALSLLCVIDGVDVTLPAFTLAADPHEDDKAFSQKEGENWIEPGLVISDGALHDEYALNHSIAKGDK